MWQLIVEEANKQFAYELTNKKSSSSLTEKNLLKTSHSGNFGR
jgi:hypothetical protein